MRFTAFSIAAAMMLAAFAGCRDDAEPPEEEKTEEPAPKRAPRQRWKPAPKRPEPQRPIRPQKKTAPPPADAPAAPDKKSGGGKEKGKKKDGKDGGKEKGKDRGGKDGGNGGQGKGQGGQNGQGGNGNGQGGSGGGQGGGNGQGGPHGQGGSGGGQGGGNGQGGSQGQGGQGGHGGRGGDRLPKGWEDDRVTVPPADSEKQIWDMMVGELAKLTAGPAEFAPLGASGTSLKGDQNSYHATGRCTVTDASGARSGYTFSCEFIGNGYEVGIVRVEFHPAGGD